MYSIRATGSASRGRIVLVGSSVKLKPVTAHRERSRDVTKRPAFVMCAWCQDRVATGTLVAVAEDDPVPPVGMALAKDLGRLCFECGWHFHGGHGESGEYHFLTDGDEHHAKGRRRS